MKKITLLAMSLLINTSAFAGDLSKKNTVQVKGKIGVVVDGDTIKVQLQQSDYNNLKNRAENRKEKSNFNDKYQSVTVRVASINTEESVHSVKAKNTKKGKESSNYLKNLALNKEAIINCYGFGYFGRLICNVNVNNQFDIAYQMIITGRSDYITKYGENPFNHKQYLYAQEQQTQYNLK